MFLAFNPNSEPIILFWGLLSFVLAPVWTGIAVVHLIKGKRVTVLVGAGAVSGLCILLFVTAAGLLKPTNQASDHEGLAVVAVMVTDMMHQFIYWCNVAVVVAVLGVIPYPIAFACRGLSRRRALK